MPTTMAVTTPFPASWRPSARRLLRCGAGALAAACLSAGVAAAATWRLEPQISVSETYSDNEDLEPNGQKRQTLTTEISPGVSVRGEGARLHLAVDAAVNLRVQKLNDKERETDVDLAATGNGEIVPDLFFVDGAASISRQSLNNREATSASATNTTNLDVVQTYSLSPYFKHRLGNFADVEERYEVSRVDESGNNFSDSTTHEISLNVDSGSLFSRIKWDVEAVATNSIESDDEDTFERHADLNLEVVVDPTFSLLGSGGYERDDFGDTERKIKGPTWRAGLRWHPGPRLEFEGTYGDRHDDKVLDVSLLYRITPRTRVLGTVNTTLDEPQDRLIRDLGAAGVAPDTGAIIDTRTGLPFNPNTSPFAFSNEATRTTTYTLRLDGTRGRNTFGVFFSKSKEEGVTSGIEDKDLTVGASLGRRLTRRTDLNTSVSYQRSTFGSDGQIDNEYTFVGGLSYTVSKNAQASLSYSFRRRASTSALDRFTENAVTVAAQYLF